MENENMEQVEVKNEGKVQEVENIEVDNAITENDSDKFTEEISKKIQSETDKVRTEYTKKIKALEEQLKELQPVEPTEEEKALQDKLQALEQKEKEIAKKEMEIKVAETLSKNGLPQQLNKYLSIEEVQDVESYLQEFKEIINSQIANSNSTYKPNNHKGQSESISKDQFAKMSYSDRLNLFKTNEELYKQLSK